MLPTKANPRSCTSRANKQRTFEQRNLWRSLEDGYDLWKSTNSSGASSRIILKLMKRSRIAETQCSGICNNTKMQFHQNTCLFAFRKIIVRVCLDESLFYGAETMTLTTQHIKAYESARLFVLRTMRRITRMDQNYHHISGTRMLNENRMATCGEKIRRRTFGFWKKIISKAPLLRLSPERMLMGMPYILWDDQVFSTRRPSKELRENYDEIFDGESVAIVLLHGNTRKAGRL